MQKKKKKRKHSSSRKEEVEHMLVEGGEEGTRYRGGKKFDDAKKGKTRVNLTQVLV